MYHLSQSKLDKIQRKTERRITIDPNVIVNLALTALNEVLSIIAHVKSQGSMTTEQIVALADQQDLANKDAIKSLLAL